MPAVTLKAPKLPFPSTTRVRDEESVTRTFRHPFRGTSAVNRNLVTAATLPTSVVAGAFKVPALAAPAAFLTGPLVVTAVLDSAQQAAQVFKTKYPNAVRDVEEQRVAVAARAVREAREHDARTSVTTLGGDSGGASVAALHDQVVLKRLERQLAAVDTERWTGPLQTAALTGYATAQFVGGTGAALRLVDAAAPAANVANAASVAGTIAGAVAIPAQALMIGASGLKVRDGVRNHRQFNRDARAVGTLGGQADHALLQSCEETLKRRRQYTAAKVGASVWNIAGQACGIAATACTFGAVTAPVGAVLATASIGSVVGSIATGAVVQSKEGNFTGGKAVRPAAERPGHRDVSSLLEQGESIGGVLDVLADDQRASQARLVTAKLMSLVSHVLDKEDKRVGRPPWLPHEREDAVRKLVDAGGRKSLFAGTSLLPRERQALRALFQTRLAHSHFFAGSVDDVRGRVLDVLHSDPVIDSLSQHDRVRQRLMTRAVRLAQSSGDPELKAALHLKRGDAKRVIEGEAWSALVQSNPQAHRAQQIADCRRLPREAKREAAADRVGVVGQVVDLAHNEAKSRTHGRMENLKDGSQLTWV